MSDWLAFRLAIVLEGIVGDLWDWIIRHRYDYCDEHGGHQFEPDATFGLRCRRCGIGRSGSSDAEEEVPT